MSCKHWRHGELVSSDLGFSWTAWVRVLVVNLESFEVCLNGQRIFWFLLEFRRTKWEEGLRGLAFSAEKEGQPLFWTLWIQKSLAGRINLF